LAAARGSAALTHHLAVVEWRMRVQRCWPTLVVLSSLALGSCAHKGALARAGDVCKLTGGARLVIAELDPDSTQTLIRGQRVDLKAQVGYFVPEAKTVFLRMMVLDPSGQDIWQPEGA